MSARTPPRIIRTATLSLALGATCATQSQTPQRDLSQGNTGYLVPYAHLDTQWRWAYPQVIREFIKNTLERNFTLIDKYPHYVFNFSGSRRYEMMKEYYPADFERLKGYIQSGRWFPCGSSVDEGDANIPSSESLIRHVLYGNRYFRKEFGVASNEFMLPDCFGFPYALPSILAHCGIKGFSTQKLTWGSAVGIPFPVGVWEGPDGKSVVAALDPGSYGASVTEDLSENTSWLARIQKTGRQSGAYVDFHYYGTGDTGGAPRASSVDWVEQSIAGKGPVTVVSAKADQMFLDLKPQQIDNLPRYKGELLLTNHSAGSLSSQAYMKRSNRKSELLADGAEKSSVAAMLFGGTPYPGDRLYRAWDLVLGSQMHDMLPGTSIPKAYEFCWNDFLLAQNQFAAVETDAVGAIAKHMDTRGAGIPIVVYNPLSVAREDVAEATVPDLGPGALVEVKGPNGEIKEGQVLSRDGTSMHIAFLAKAPPTGFATYLVRRHPSPNWLTATDLNVDAHHLENNHFIVKVNAAGDIATIYDKRTGHEVLKSPSRLEMQYENPSAFPAWNMDWDDAKQPPREVVGGPAKIRISENGSVRVALQVERECNGSKFVQQIRLASGSDRVEVNNIIDWQTRERALKASFPLTSGNPEATYDLQLGATTRGNDNPKKFEVPQHQWFDLTKPDGSYGVGVLNDCKFASNKPNDDTLNLTLIYTPGVSAGFDDQATQDFGRNEILYAIVPHAGDWRKGNLPWQAKRLNQPLRTFLATAHPGSLGKSFSVVSTGGAHVEVQALKKAEDGNEIVVRLRELTGAAASGVAVKFALPVLSAREVDGQERPIGPAEVRNGELVADVPAFSLKAYAVKLATQRAHPAHETISIPVKLPYNRCVTSTDAHPAGGEFADGLAIAAEQLPKTLTLDDVTFTFGPAGEGMKNAVTASGQTIELPKGYSRLYLLAAADGDVTGIFKFGNRTVAKRIENWAGFIGQWDNRQWVGDPGPDFSNYGEMNGLVPGYTKRGEVAWFASHRHDATGNTYYDYSYLYKVGFELPAGGAAITLPNDPRIKVLAISVARDGHDGIAAQPLYDTLSNHVIGGGPVVTPASGHFSDATEVRIDPPLYFHGGVRHYTLDGTTPTADSPTYKGPVMLNDPATVKVAQFENGRQVGSITTATIDVHDITPPSVVSANEARALGIAKLVFSEPVTEASAEDTANYKFSSGVGVTSAKLGSDRRSVELVLDHPSASGEVEKLTISGVKDMASTPNTASATVTLAERGAVFTSPSLEPKVSRFFPNTKGLPTHPGDSWTLNLFCKIDEAPENRTLIAGFGRSRDGRAGTGRYFAKFARGINFWVADQDVQTTVPLDTGKWQMLTATYDGKVMRLYKNGEQIAEQPVTLAADANQIRVMPLDAWEQRRRFGGEVQDMTIWDMDLPAGAVKRLWESSKPG